MKKYCFRVPVGRNTNDLSCALWKVVQELQLNEAIKNKEISSVTIEPQCFMGNAEFVIEITHY